MTPFKVSCDQCDASFRINDAAKIGKRVKCPKCGEAFTIRQPDDADDFDDDEFEAPVARPVRRTTAKKASRGKKSDGDGPSAAVLAGGGAAAVVLLLGAMWATGMLGGGGPAAQPVASQQPAAPASNAVPMAELLNRLPRMAEVVVHVRVKDALASPLAAGLRSPEFDAQLSSPSPLIPGTTLSGINTITLALSDVTLGISEQKRLSESGLPAAGQSPIPTDPIVVVTLNDPMTPDFLNLGDDNAIRHGNATIYRRPDAGLPGLPPCLSIVEPKLVVLGTEPQIKALLDQSTPSGLADDFNFVDGQAHVMLAMCPRTITQQVERLAANNIASPPLHLELKQFASKGGKALGLSLTLQSGLDAGIILLASDASRTGDVQAVLEGYVQTMRDGLAAPPVASNPILASLKPVAEAIQVAAAGDRVSASTSIPPETLTTLGQGAMMMAAPMMMNLGSPPGAPARGPSAAP